MLPSPKNPMMPDFMQAMYGTVIGVGSLEYVFSDPDTNNSVFRFLFFAFTIVIIAHDWYVYHKLERKTDEVFWPYTLQIGSLFFLAQMMYAAKSMEMPPAEPGNLFEQFKNLPLLQWYVYGFFYTAFNVLNTINLKKKQLPTNTNRNIYIAHILICVAVILSLNWLHFNAPLSYFILVATIILVVSLWNYREKKLEEFRVAEERKPHEKESIDVQLGLPKPDDCDALGPFNINEYPLPANKVNLVYLKIIEVFEEAEKAKSGTGLGAASTKFPEPEYKTYIVGLDITKIDQHRKDAIHDLFAP